MHAKPKFNLTVSAVSRCFFVSAFGRTASDGALVSSRGLFSANVMTEVMHRWHVEVPCAVRDLLMPQHPVRQSLFIQSRSHMQRIATISTRSCATSMHRLLPVADAHAQLLSRPGRSFTPYRAHAGDGTRGLLPSAGQTAAEVPDPPPYLRQRKNLRNNALLLPPTPSSPPSTTHRRLSRTRRQRRHFFSLVLSHTRS